MKMWRLTLFLTPLFLALALGQTAQAVTIQPVRAHIPINQGGSTTFGFNVFNETDSTLFLQSQVRPFAPADEFGNSIIKYDEQPSWLSWFSVRNDSVAIRPGETVAAVIDVAVPENAAPGGYYAAILWGESSTPGNFGIQSNIAFLTLLEVSGDLIEAGDIVGMSYQLNSNVLNPWPATFNVHLANTGNTHLQPFGFVTITNNWGWTLASVPINSGGGFVLPDSTRVFTSLWQNPLSQMAGLATGETTWRQIGQPLLSLVSFGPLTATAYVNLYGTDIVFDELTFNFPVTFPILTALVFVAIIVLIISLVKHNFFKGGNKQQKT